MGTFLGPKYLLYEGLPKVGVPLLGVPMLSTVVYWGLCWGPPILGSYHI